MFEYSHLNLLHILLLNRNVVIFRCIVMTEFNIVKDTSLGVALKKVIKCLLKAECIEINY